MKDRYCSYYTKSNEIISYMVEKLGISENDLILEPSAGEGVFIDEILKRKTKVKIDALDINEEVIKILKCKYDENPNINVRLTDTLLDKELDKYTSTMLWFKNTDTLLDEQLDYFESLGGHYDKVIGNPPYGAWQDYEKRDLLKKKYVGQYVKETYTLFLLRSISVLKMEGRLSFIIPDTFLFLNMHERFRKILLTNTKIEEILIFPSKFFPGVNFGYSNLSIITLEKCKKEEALDNTINIIKNFHSSSEFKNILKKEYLVNHKVYRLKQSDIFKTEKSYFILTESDISSKLNNTKMKLGDIADIVTGFYSGNNKKFVCVKNDSVKGAKNYSKVDKNLIFDCTDIEGIKGVDEGYISYVKGTSESRYVRKNGNWFIRWDENTIKFYKTDKKARFQNSKFYFKKGIAMPMVKSSEIKATLIENQVFDQSIVGIFPKEEEKLYYILALLNSNTINQFIHIINPTANNSSNYVKQIPYIEPSEYDYKIIVSNVKKILELDSMNDIEEIQTLHKKINEIIEKIYL